MRSDAWPAGMAALGPTANFCADAITVRLSEEQRTTSARCEHFGPWPNSDFVPSGPEASSTIRSQLRMSAGTRETLILGSSTSSNLWHSE
jgi:hypothetical protein